MVRHILPFRSTCFILREELCTFRVNCDDDDDEGHGDAEKSARLEPVEESPGSF